jgi:hypothetical protein
MSEKYFVSLWHDCSVSVNNTLLWICEVQLVFIMECDIVMNIGKVSFFFRACTLKAYV